VILNLITPHISFLHKRSIVHQINYLSNILDNGYDDELQNRYPEGRVFSNAILALALIEFSQKSNDKNSKFAQMLDARVQVLLSEKSSKTFSRKLIPEHGAFYTGWVNLVLKNYIESELFAHSTIQKEIQESHAYFTKQIISSQQDSAKLIESYHGTSWPADNLVLLQTVRNDSVQNAWLEKLFQTTQHPSKLLHHVSDDVKEIRGSSQALILYFLAQLNIDQAHKDNAKFQNLFIDSFLGIELVKENENGNSESDYDSGPVILGYGASASIMNIKTQAYLKNKKAKISWAFFNCISFPVSVFGQKFYLFKQEPMYDLFMLWCSTELYKMK